MTWQQLPFIEKVKQNQAAFGKKVIDISYRLGVEPAWLMIVMNNETGGTFDPAQRNLGGSSATGLIQFMKDTAIGLGTTTDALAKMSNIEQLDWVERYFNTYASKITSAADTYLAVFYPAAIGKPGTYQFPTSIVAGNKIFDLNKDGQLTKREFDEYVNTKYAAYLKEDANVTNVLKRKILNKRTLPVFIGLTAVLIGGAIIIYTSKK